MGACVNINNPDIGQIEQLFDLDEPSLPGLCNKTVEESCCTCLKKKTCRDTGCSSQFGGEGNGIFFQNRSDLFTVRICKITGKKYSSAIFVAEYFLTCFFLGPKTFGSIN